MENIPPPQGAQQIDLDILLEMTWKVCDRTRDRRIGEHLIAIMPQEVLYVLASYLGEQTFEYLRAQGMTNDYVAEWVERRNSRKDKPLA